MVLELWSNIAKCIHNCLNTWLIRLEILFELSDDHDNAFSNDDDFYTNTIDKFHSQ